ncbi:hypothetical protein, partial [Tessaracoccus sp.]
RKKGVDASLKSDLKSAATQVETWVTDFPTTAIVTSTTAASPTVAALPDTGTAGVAELATDTALAGAKVSPGNTVTLTKSATAGAYCIFVYNDGASTAISPTAQLSYSSLDGGIQIGTKGDTTCT